MINDFGYQKNQFVVMFDMRKSKILLKDSEQQNRNSLQQNNLTFNALTKRPLELVFCYQRYCLDSISATHYLRQI